jgi:broad specificity phosphatase PhoE
MHQAELPGAIELTLVRHGESVGNVAASAAAASGAEVIDVGQRDADVPLTDTGVAQATALGRSLAELGADARPESVWCSPYLRARQTARTALETAALELPFRVDERVRDRELGILDLLTGEGVAARFPEEATRRQWLGKFYYRPPGGESWADVALRLRSVMADIDRLDAGRRVLVVCHDAVIMLFRYVCEGMDEEQLLELGRTSTVRNASLTRLVRPSGLGLWTAQEFNRSEHLREHGATVTDHGSDAPVDPHQEMEPAQAARS